MCATWPWWSCFSVIYKEKQKNSFSSGGWECQHRTWWDCQLEQSVSNYTARDIMAGLQCIKPLLQRRMHIWKFSGAETIGTGLQKCGKKWHVRWVILHILNKWASACVAYTKRTVQCSAPTVRGSSGSVMLSGTICLLRGKSHCKLIQSCSKTSPLMKHQKLELIISCLVQDHTVTTSQPRWTQMRDFVLLCETALPNTFIKDTLCWLFL